MHIGSSVPLITENFKFWLWGKIFTIRLSNLNQLNQKRNTNDIGVWKIMRTRIQIRISFGFKISFIWNSFHILWRLCLVNVIQVLCNHSDFYSVFFVKIVFPSLENVCEKKKHFATEHETEVLVENWKVKEVEPIYQSSEPLRTKTSRHGPEVSGLRKEGWELWQNIAHNANIVCTCGLRNAHIVWH